MTNFNLNTESTALVLDTTRKVFSFDAETNGLWGQAFSLAAVIYEGGKEVKSFIARCPISEEVNPWVNDNVLPQMEGIPVTHDSYEAMLQAFAEFYLAEKAGADIVVHMGVPVESRVLQDMHAEGYIGDWDGPYPLIDIAGNLQQIGEDPTSVDAYNAKHGLSTLIPDCEGGTHNPLYDSRAAAVCYLHMMANKK